MKKNKTHMCVNNLAYVEYGTHLPVLLNFNSNIHELQALETCTCALYLSAITIFYDAKELSHERS